MINIEIYNRDKNTSEKLQFNKGVLSIGRLPKNDIYLDSSTVSRNHAEIVLIDRKFYIADLESGNGTFLNNEQLIPHQKKPLSSDDTIRIEHFEIKIDYELPEPSADYSEEYTDHGVIEVKMLKKVLSALDESDLPSFEVTYPEDLNAQAHFPEDLDEIYIGRDEECQLSIKSGLVSRKHAVCKRKWGGITIKDLKSKNLTKVNGQIIDEVALHDGDQIVLGDIEIIFKNPKEINFEEISREYEENSPYHSVPEDDSSISPPPEEDVENESQISEQAMQSLVNENTDNESESDENEAKSQDENDQDEDSQKDKDSSSEDDQEDQSKDEQKSDDPSEIKPKPAKRKKRRRLTCLEILLMFGVLGILSAASFLLYYLLK